MTVLGIVAVLFLIGVAAYVVVALMATRDIDPQSGEYRDKQGKRYGKFKKDEWDRIRRNYDW